MAENPPVKPPIADLHCDLLTYLVLDKKYTAHDADARCSIPQLRQGGVALQVLAIFVPPLPGVDEMGLEQAKIFRRLVSQEDDLEALESVELLALETASEQPIRVIAAIENATVLCGDDGRLAPGLERLDRIEAEVGRLLYVSLTWNNENRFGGGCGSRRGLKDDGRHLLDVLIDKGIAIDFSHTSQWLAADILDYLESLGAQPAVLASHSNFQAVRDLPRNLPDEIGREIIRRGGVIGLNVLRSFLEPESADGFVANAKYALELGGAENYVLGADFFADNTLPPELRLNARDGYFLDDYGNSSCYPDLLGYLGDAAEWPSGFLADMRWNNARRFVAGVLSGE